ncbi:MAG: hypothetical protein MAG431_00575 [Chloroflexi bacterium]|nr:hypothetical protein [Chloroflexota bacterium]
MGVLALRTSGMHALAGGPQSVGNTVWLRENPPRVDLAEVAGIETRPALTSLKRRVRCNRPGSGKWANCRQAFYKNLTSNY